MKSAKSLCFISSILFLFASGVERGYCQDSLLKSSFTLSTNVSQFFTGDVSIYAEYRPLGILSIGGSAGTIFPVRSRASLMDPNYNSNDDEYPFWIYKGYVLRFYTKFYSRKRASYISTLLLYKNLHYSRYNFIDRIIHGEDLEHYNRSETAQVFSFQLLWGRESVHRHFLIDKYIGLGARFRIREFYTYSCYATYQDHGPTTCPYTDTGDGSKNQFFPEFHLGVRMGYQK